MRIRMLGAAALVAAATMISLPTLSAEEDKPKFTTKQIMKEAFKGPLLKKVAAGGSKEDAKKLHEMLVALAANEPKKGSEESWKKLTGALVAAAEGVVEGKDGSAAALKKAANCKACHNSHK
ncbi:hypothetical protein SV7mr_43430 [Stieleria bergensis]|uniref:Cytochrome C n=1 Tax=Stieleria bergensis TaxID=2528025 RepID=A0A517T0E5_9BACT|nr:MAG: hypothetical protein CBB71_19990 [Rhodopirellula sp. TMED11]QDT61803.1 hypothetical protein SV7mr_43430 [Planctomycetes bacterium SV_7m_r]